MKEKRKLKVMFNKSGGNSSKNSYSPKISLPKIWLDKMNISPDDREVNMTFNNNKIIIEKYNKD